jgi:hypothetical protein
VCGGLSKVLKSIELSERVQRKFVRYALRGLGWTDMCELPPYVDRCALIRLETLAERYFVYFDILSGRVSSSNLLSLISINASWYHTRAGDFLRVDLHRTNYSVITNHLMSSLVYSTFIYQGINFLIV